MKKKLEDKEYTRKRKKQKTSKSEDDTEEVVKAEVLDVTTLREGMLLLGCVTEIRSNCFLMSLPGCLVGTVPFTNVSRKFVEELRRSTEAAEDMIDGSLESVVRLGAVYPCKVVEIASKENLRKPMITLSIDPKDVNEELRLQSLYLKMVVYAAVESVEDHGYVMDLGVKGAQGFLPFSLYCDSSTLTVGQVVATQVKKMPSPKSGNVVWLANLSFDDTYPEIEEEDMKLTSILPGANVVAYVTNVKHPFYYMKCMNFDACANISSCGGKQDLTEGMKVSATVLYVHPISHMIYLFLGSKPTPQTFQRFFRTRKFDLLKNVKFEFGWHTKLFFRINKGALGFIKKGELPEKGDFSQESLLKTPLVPKARAIFLHYMDNLVQLSFHEGMLNLEIKRLEDVKVGDVLEGTVKKHVERGMFIQVCPGLSGFVRQVFMSDVFITMPEKLHPVDSQVKCRVLSKNHPSGLDLTTKESLLSVPREELLLSYEEAQEGSIYKGVIVQKKQAHILVLFFNDVKGVVPSEEVPKSSLLYVGQTVSCEVLQCIPNKQRLKLSMMGRAKSSAKKSNKPAKSAALEVSLFDPAKTYKAIITNITAHQLNVVVEGMHKGRVHISQLGTPEENCLPLREFTTGMALKVHILGQSDRRSQNLLPISHRITKHFLECSLQYPPPVPLDRKLRPGMSVTGFVKEIYPTYASLWLSPICTGSLEYLHFSENPKVLRKLKKQLKVGLSLNVSVLEKKQKVQGKSGILLTKLGNTDIQAGTNVVGLVKSASVEEGGLQLELAHGYEGTVCLSDLQDQYAPVLPLLSKCSKLRFVLCHVLEVDHAKRSCHLSLRKSRLYGCPGEYPGTTEVTPSDMAEGKRFKGYVKKSSDNLLIISLGRGMDGQVRTHSCSSLGCVLCQRTQSVLRKYSVGGVVEVVVAGGSSSKKNLYSLSLPELADLESSAKPSRLKVTEDINWDDV